MKKIIFSTIILLTSCNNIDTNECHTNQDTKVQNVDVYNLKWKCYPVSKMEMLNEDEELHEYYIIDTDTARVFSHCENCKYCIEYVNVSE